MTVEADDIDVASGWLRPAVFGAMDGLVSNFALIMGVAGGAAAASVSSDAIVLAGLAGLAAGAFSMAAGEYTSVASQAEYERKLIDHERQEILDDAAGEEQQLAGFFEDMGLEPDDAITAAAQVHSNLDEAVRVHALHEYGLDIEKPPSAILAAASSFVAFACGAAIPLVPYLLGASSPLVSIVVSLIALFGCGAVVTQITDRTWWFGGTRQLLLGAAAAGLTYLIGLGIGGVVV